MGYTGMGMVSKILNLCYTIPIPMVSQVFMGSTLKCSSAAEDEPCLLQTWNLSVLTVLYDNFHSKWFSHLCSVVLQQISNYSHNPGIHPHVYLQVGWRVVTIRNENGITDNGDRLQQMSGMTDNDNR